MNFLQKARGFVFSPSHKRTMSVLLMLVLVSAVTLTVTLSQQKQTIKQHAAQADCLALGGKGCYSNYNDYSWMEQLPGSTNTCGGGEECLVVSACINVGGKNTNNSHCPIGTIRDKNGERAGDISLCCVSGTIPADIPECGTGRAGCNYMNIKDGCSSTACLSSAGTFAGSDLASNGDKLVCCPFSQCRDGYKGSCTGYNTDYCPNGSHPALNSAGINDRADCSSGPNSENGQQCCVPDNSAPSPVTTTCSSLCSGYGRHFCASSNASYGNYSECNNGSCNYSFYKPSGNGDCSGSTPDCWCDQSVSAPACEKGTNCTSSGYTAPTVTSCSSDATCDTCLKDTNNCVWDGSCIKTPTVDPEKCPAGGTGTWNYLSCDTNVCTSTNTCGQIGSNNGYCELKSSSGDYTCDNSNYSYSSLYTCSSGNICCVPKTITYTQLSVDVVQGSTTPTAGTNQTYTATIHDDSAYISTINCLLYDLAVDGTGQELPMTILAGTTALDRTASYTFSSITAGSHPLYAVCTDSNPLTPATGERGPTLLVTVSSGGTNPVTKFDCKNTTGYTCLSSSSCDTGYTPYSPTSGTTCDAGQICCQKNIAAGDTVIQLPTNAFTTLFTYSASSELLMSKDQNITVYLYPSTFDLSTDPKGNSPTYKQIGVLSASTVTTTNFDLGPVTAGQYKVLLKAPQYLRVLEGTYTVPQGGGIIPLTLNKNLVNGVGDTDNSNTLDSLDYGTILGCTGKRPNTVCTNKAGADLNGDGVVDQIDLSIFLRSLSFTNRSGD